MANIDLDNQSDDELNLSHSRVSFASMEDTSAATFAVRRTLRPRVSATNLPAKKNKRPRRQSTGQENAQLFVRRADKRVKLDHQKAKTAANIFRKTDIDAARKRWMRQHLELLSPLLPRGSHIIESIRADAGDEKLYTPLHQLGEQPRLIKGGEMKDYQLQRHTWSMLGAYLRNGFMHLLTATSKLQGLSFLAWMYNNGMNCILGDEMGLGKTLQTLSLFAYIKEKTPESEVLPPHLVLCPLSVLSSWMAEIERWLPSFRALRFHAQHRERENMKSAVKSGKIEFDICVTTYEQYALDDGWFKSRRWTYCVLDEGHKIKNTATNISRSLQGIGSNYRLLLTGTPLQNNMLELWGLFHWLYPTVFTSTSEQLFKDSFDLAQGRYDMSFLEASEKLLSTIMLRRTKNSVEQSVPPREETNVYIPLSELQRFWTYRLITRMDTLDLNQIFSKAEDGVPADEGRKEVLQNVAQHLQLSKTGEANQWKRLMNLVMQLRQICDHPYMLEDAAPDPYHIGDHIVAASSKLVVIDKLLADILPRGEKVLIFTQFVGMLDLLDDFMRLRNIPFARMDGQTLRPRRALDIRLFQQENSPYQVYIISTKAGGLGINLTKASHVIMCDSDFNPQNDLQAIARAHRIGQTKTVKVYRLICSGTVEDQMFEFIRRKLFLSVKVLGAEDGSSEQGPHLRTQELLNILRRGSSALADAPAGCMQSIAAFTATPIAEILRVSAERERVREVRVKREVEGVKSEDPEEVARSAEEEEQELLSGVARVRGKLFEGKELARSTNKDIAAEWEQRQKRDHVNRLVKFNGIQHVRDDEPQLRVPGPPKRKRKTFEHEEWCIYCRDGGNLVVCNLCPRVFHAECHGLRPSQVKAMSFISCSQHECAGCERRTIDAGGMLFRCRTCPHAFCEDCLPPGELRTVGASLPEFEILGIGEIAQAFFIHCQDCVEYFESNPKQWNIWEKEFEETAAKVAALD